MHNPTWYIWAACCAWLLAPALVALFVYRFMLVTAARRPVITKSTSSRDKRKITVWVLDIAERTSIVHCDEEADEPEEDEKHD